MTFIGEIALIKLVRHYDYDIDRKQARKILDLLDDTLGKFTETDIEMATDYVVNGEKSVFKNYFE